MIMRKKKHACYGYLRYPCCENPVVLVILLRSLLLRNSRNTRIHTSIYCIANQLRAAKHDRLDRNFLATNQPQIHYVEEHISDLT